MRILLLSPPTEKSGRVIRDTIYGCWHETKTNYLWPPLSLLYIAGNLIERNKGAKIRVMDAQADGLKTRDIIEQAETEKPDLIGITTDGVTIREDLSLLRDLKTRLPETQTAASGSVATAYPEDIAKEKCVDFVIRGYPENSFSELAETIEKNDDPAKVMGLTYKEKGKIIHNRERPQENLDALAYPARELVDCKKYSNPLSKRKKFTTMLSSRGCPSNCIFCTSPTISKGRYLPRAAEKVADEIEHVVEKQGIRDFFFRDENLTLIKKRTLRMADEIKKRGLDVSWMCNSRVDTVDRQTMDAMKESGCYLIKFGVESASQKVLDGLKKGTRVCEIDKTFDAARKAGIDTVAHFMIGSPMDTKETIEETAEFAKKINPTYAAFDLTRPLPGTKLFEGLVEKMAVTEYSPDEPYNEMMTGIEQEEIERLYAKAYRTFYLRPALLPRLMRTMGIRQALASAIRYAR